MSEKAHIPGFAFSFQAIVNISYLHWDGGVRESSFVLQTLLMKARRGHWILLSRDVTCFGLETSRLIVGRVS